MREAAFIKQNKDKWLQFEEILQNTTTVSPDRLSDVYIEISDDLSYANTFYPHSNSVAYLNGIASMAHQKIYKTKKEGKNRFITFFKEEFPLEFYKHQRQLLIAFLVFAFFTVVGFYSGEVDQQYETLKLALGPSGDSYVNMTLENIDKGDPMAVYKDANEAKMFLGITLNNIRVAMYALLLGLLFSVGTLFLMMRNGIMLGSFLQIFYEHDLLWESSRTIWIHGTIEISVIIIASCAGMVLGNGLMFPKTYTRLESLKRSAKAALKIMISTIPFFIVAGFLEGFVTRHTEMPDWLAIFIIVTSLALIIFYYVIYPIQVHRKFNQIKDYAKQ